MNIKLFIVMGVSWLIEIVSTLVQGLDGFWYFSDAFNILQGVLVFIIFAFKKKVWKAIQQRLGIYTYKNLFLLFYVNECFLWFFKVYQRKLLQKVQWVLQQCFQTAEIIFIWQKMVKLLKVAATPL